MCKRNIEIVKRREEKDKIRIGSNIWLAQHNKDQSIQPKIQKFDRLIFIRNSSIILVESQEYFSVKDKKGFNKIIC